MIARTSSGGCGPDVADDMGTDVQYSGTTGRFQVQKSAMQENWQVLTPEEDSVWKELLIPR